MVDLHVSSPAASGGLVGRERELERIRTFLVRAAAEGDALLLLGEPGVGTTVLLDAAAREATAAGTRVLRTAGAEFEADVALSGLNRLLLPLREDVADLGPAHRRALSTGAELRALGAGAAPHEELGAGSLTPQERETALLAATGLSNKEIGRRLYLSHRTVGAHLYRVFPKFGITSRAALRDALDVERPQR